MKVGYTISMLLCLYAFSAYSMKPNTENKDATWTQKDQQKIDRALAEIPAMLEEARVVQEEIAKEEREQEQKAKEDRTANIRWQNTLLCATPMMGRWPRVGLYKKDAIEGSLFLAHIISDILLYKKLQRNRITKIVIELKAQYQQIIDEIEKAKKAQVEFDKEYDEKSKLGQFFTNEQKQRDGLNNPLREYIKQHHSLIKYNPFKQETIVPILTRLALEKGGEALSSALLAKPSIYEEEGWQAYEKDAYGNTVPVRGSTPISLVTILKWGQWLSNPFVAVARSGANKFISAMGWANKTFKLGIPECIYSTTGRTAIQLIGLGWGVKTYDTANTALWAEYVVENMNKLLKILRQYKEAKASFKDIEVLKKIEAKIEKFVTKGHQASSILPGRLLRQWWSSRNKADAYISFMIAAPVAAIISYKAYSYIRAMFAEPQTSTENN